MKAISTLFAILLLVSIMVGASLAVTRTQDHQTANLTQSTPAQHFHYERASHLPSRRVSTFARASVVTLMPENIALRSNWRKVHNGKPLGRYREKSIPLLRV